MKYFRLKPKEIRKVTTHPMLTQKSTEIADQVGLPTVGIGTFLPIILQLLQSLLGGLGICNPTPPPAAKVHDMLANPNRMHQKALKRETRRLLRQNGKLASLESVIVDGTLAVAGNLTQAEAAQLWTEVNGTMPAS